MIEIDLNDALLYIELLDEQNIYNNKNGIYYLKIRTFCFRCFNKISIVILTIKYLFFSLNKKRRIIMLLM